MRSLQTRYSLSLGASVFLHGAALYAVALALQFEFFEPIEEGQRVELLRVEPVEGKVGLTPMTGPSGADSEKDKEKLSTSAKRKSVFVEEKLHSEPVGNPFPKEQIEKVEQNKRERKPASSQERPKPKSQPIEESSGTEPLHIGQPKKTEETVPTPEETKTEETVPTPEETEETSEIPEIVDCNTFARKKPNYPSRFNGWEVVQTYSNQVKSSLLDPKNYATPGVEIEISERKRAIFHRYFVAIHARHIHPVFADGYLASLDKLSIRDPLNDPHLHLHVEFEIMQDGSLGAVRVLRRSGNWEFDAGALNAIYSAAPFPPPPKAIHSWNGRTYAKWGFFRNQRKCGVFNADPYLLEKP